MLAPTRDEDSLACFYKSWIRLSAPPRIPHRVKNGGTKEYAGMVELVDSVDLGSTARACRFESCCPHQKTREAFASLVFCYGLGLEPIYIQVSGGHLLPPVQKLVATSIFLFPLGKGKCTSSLVAHYLYWLFISAFPIKKSRSRTHLHASTRYQH